MPQPSLCGRGKQAGDCAKLWLPFLSADAVPVVQAEWSSASGLLQEQPGAQLPCLADSPAAELSRAPTMPLLAVEAALATSGVTASSATHALAAAASASAAAASDHSHATATSDKRDQGTTTKAKAKGPGSKGRHRTRDSAKHKTM